jgi:RNA polymerase sigma factor (sigma-70 family)
MASAQLTRVMRHIQQLAGADPEQSDARLLQCFLANRDESAFRLLVGRHGRMVLSVCRNVLRQTQDAEDAFQATFLVLARNAASIREGTALASWLYGVAYRIALKARSQMSKRHHYEKRAAPRQAERPDLDLALRELQTVLAEEVHRLPQKYRAPFVLCCLEGKSRNEAAQELGWKEGTVCGRLAEARKRLQQRFTRRGLTLSAALCAGAVSAGVEAAAPKTLLRTTIQAALGIAAGQSAAGVAPAPVAKLVEGVTRTMFLNKVKLAGVLILSAGLLATGVGSQLRHAFANPASDEAPKTKAVRVADKPASEKPAAAPKEDGKRVIQGRVLDPDGKALEGARVFLPGTVWGDAKKAGTLVDIKSGAEGHFRFTLERAQLVRGRSLVAMAQGYAPAWIEADKIGKDDVTLRLAKDLPIRGRILDLEGRPIKGVTVKVRRVAAAPEGDLAPVLKSMQRDGNRVFTHPLHEVYMNPEAPFFAPVKTDAEGRFHLDGLGAERVVVLWTEGPTIAHQVVYVLTRPGLNVEELVKNAPERIGIPGRKTPLPVIYGPDFDHPATPCKPILGVVRDQRTGKPLEGVSINGSSGGWWENYIQTKTDKEGRYKLVGVAKGRSYHISAWALPQDYLQGGKNIADTEGLAPLTLDMELIKGIRVRGRITDKQTGKPVPAAFWYSPLSDNKYFAALPGKDAGLFLGLGMRNEKDGSYSMLALPGPGLIKYRAEVENNPYTQVVLDPAHRGKAHVDEGLGESFIGPGGVYLTLFGHNAYRLIDPAADAKTVECDIQFDRGRTRTGKVVDADGKPLTGVRAGGLAPLGGNETLKDGTFKAVGLNPAKPRLIAFVHPERKPLAGIKVNAGYRENVPRWLTEDEKSGYVVQTDAEGRFRVEGIFPGLKFGLGLRKGNSFLVTAEQFQTMTLEAGTRDLGDIAAKPWRP